MDPLTVWGIASTAGPLVLRVLGKLVEGSLEDYTKDFFKGRIDGAIARTAKLVGRGEKDPLEVAVVEALKELLGLAQRELRLRCQLPEAGIEAYARPMWEFVRDEEAIALLRQGFEKNCQELDGSALARVWQRLGLTALPPKFNWQKVVASYLDRAQELRLESPELRGILDSQNLQQIQEHTEALAGPPKDFDLQKYRETIEERYATLNLDSINASVYDYRERLKVWQIFVPQNVREYREYLPQAYELPLEIRQRMVAAGELDGELEAEALERYRQAYREQPIRSVLELREDANTRYCVILGDPGSGKSTLLQAIALEWAKMPFSRAVREPLPLLVELRMYDRDRESGDCKNFLEFIHQGPNWTQHLNQNRLHEKLKKGEAIALFDGLDEVFDPQRRETIINQIHDFTQEYPDVRVLVTSRPIGYKAKRLQDAEFRHFLLQDLDEAQIEDFVRRWHELTYTQESEKTRIRERLLRSLRHSKAIRELAGNPLLLTLMAILNRSQELPRDRARLYERASELLLYQWDVERKLEDERIKDIQIDYTDKQAMLRRVASFMQAGEKGLAGNIIRREDLEAILRGYLKERDIPNSHGVARVILEQLRSRNFILCYVGANGYAFVHRTFLEYFCATELVERFNRRGTEGGLSLDDLQAEVYGKRWRDESWHEVLRLIASLVNVQFVGEAIETLMAADGEEEDFTNLFLAAECLVEAKNRSEIVETENRLKERLQALVAYDPPYFYEFDYSEVQRVEEIRMEAVGAIAVTWQEQDTTKDWLKDRAQYDNDGKVRYAAVAAIAQSWKDNPNTLPWLQKRAQNDDNWLVRHVAVKAIVQNWKNNLDTLPWLQERALHDNDAFVRQEAVKAIAQNWKDAPNTLPWLQERAQNDDDWSVRGVAVKAIAQDWKDNPDTLSWLQERALHDNDALVRQEAVKAIAQGWKDDPDILPWLQERALHDDDEDVRSAAVRAIAQSWQDAPDTLTWLQKRVRSKDSGNLRRAAMQEIVKGWKDEPGTLPLLQEHAQHDDSWVVREVAVRAIAENWQGDPNVLSLFRERARNDSDGGVRNTAVEAIAKKWQDDPQAFETFCFVAAQDPFQREEEWQSNPRAIALRALARWHHNNPRTLEILQDRAKNDNDDEVRELAQRALEKLTRDRT